MAYSYVTYNGDGNTQVFSVPFPYLEHNNVKLILDNTSTSGIPIPENAYEWLSASSVRLSTTAIPPVGSVLRIQRFTEKAIPVVDYRDGSVLSERDLDLTVTQLLYICQEAYDALDGETAVGAKEEAKRILLEVQSLYGKTKEEIDYFRRMYIVVEAANGAAGSGEYDFATGRMLFRIPAGPTGPQGPQGAEGPQGIAGPRGEQGPRGLQGIQGVQGARGPEGQQGIIGPQGVQGVRGAQGEVGPMGPQGTKGDTGERGPQGVEGPKGAMGDKGPLGDSPLPATFGNFRVNPKGYLEFEYNGVVDATTFTINPVTGILEVKLA